MYNTSTPGEVYSIVCNMTPDKNTPCADPPSSVETHGTAGSKTNTKALVVIPLWEYNPSVSSNEDARKSAPPDC
jgi:hypothetical protein